MGRNGDGYHMFSPRRDRSNDVTVTVRSAVHTGLVRIPRAMYGRVVTAPEMLSLRRAGILFLRSSPCVTVLIVGVPAYRPAAFIRKIHCSRESRS